MERKISNHEKNKEAQKLLVNKLEQLGAVNIKSAIQNRRKYVECSIQGKKKIIFYNSKTKGDWQLSLNHSEDCDPYSKNNKFWILIDTSANKFFVTPERWLAKNMFDVHEIYKQNHGGKRPVNNDSKHHSKSENEIKQWEEAWDIVFEKQIDVVYDDEIQKENEYAEGCVININVNSYERNQSARTECLNSKGFSCIVCGFDFKKFYGDIGNKFIHVHHKVELSSIGKSYSVDPQNDLVPVCPNCHSMLHKKKPAYTVDELKKIIKENSKS